MLLLPDDYDASQPAPLLFLLHGFTASGLVQDLYLGIEAPARERGMLYLRPDGTVNPDGSRFWNATDACCDFFGSGVDDSGYLRGLIDEVSAHYLVDKKRIYFIGHSNGHYMSYRMACDHADTIAAIAGLAGAMYKKPDEQCAASEPVHSLHVHGDQDTSVDYEGTGNYLGALASTQWWADKAGCDAGVDAEPLDLEQDVAGAETTVKRFENGCQPGGSAELWSIIGGGHLPGFDKTFAPRVLDYLVSKSKP